MLRIVPWTLTLVLLAAAGLWGRDLMSAVDAPPLPVTDAARAQEALATDAPVTEPQPPAPPQTWPTLFGEVQPPAPPPPEPEPQPPEPEPQPPAPPPPAGPPLSSLSYRLNGVIRSGDAVWAMVSHPTGEQIMRVGDTLEEGMTVVRIDSAGLWVDTGRDAPELLGFAEDEG